MADDATPLASLSVTHVFYDPSDPISLLCAYLALLPQALCVVYATLCWSTREVEVLLLFAGQLACEAANFALKRLIKEERPRRMNGKGYGMPSSHAQFVCFWAVGLALFLLLRHGGGLTSSSPDKRRRRQQRQTHPAPAVSGVIPYPARLLVSALALAVAAAVSASRLYLNYHTPRQVGVGCAAGVVCALAWFVVTGTARSYGWIAWALELPPARWLRIRDLAVLEDLDLAGWQKWQAVKEVEAEDEDGETPSPKAVAGTRKSTGGRKKKVG